jgi:dihydroflavonol-4-reductase
LTQSEDLVVVTGATGYIAQHCVLELLKAGYRVRGTVRDRARAERLKEALGRLTSVPGRLEFAETALDRDEGWDAALAGAKFVLHVASPLPLVPPKDDNELIGPAREGTLRVLQSAVRAGVERVVLTSSIAAVVFGTPREGTNVFDEASWSDTSKDIGAYEKSKTLAERAAWDFVESLPEGSKLELVTVNPGFVFGPTLDEHVGASVGLVKRFLTKDVPGCAHWYLACVDVRDIAELHLMAMTSPAAAGQRFLGTGESAWMIDMARILDRHFRPRGYSVPTRLIPNWLVRVVAFFDPSVRPILKALGKQPEFSHERATGVLGWKPRGLEETLVATGESLIEHGLI